MWIYDPPLSGGYRYMVCGGSKTGGFSSYATIVAILIEIDLCQPTERCPWLLWCRIIGDSESTPYRFKMPLGFALLQIYYAKLL